MSSWKRPDSNTATADNKTLINSRVDQWKPEMQTRIFTCSRILTNFTEIFNSLWRHRQHVLFSLIKLLFSVLTKRKTIYEARTGNSYNSERVIFVLIAQWKHTCRPIKTQVLSQAIEVTQTDPSKCIIFW